MQTITTRTASLLERMPRWFTIQAVAALKVEHVEGEARRKAEAADRRRRLGDSNRELEFLCAIEVAESDFGEWLDTVAAFSAK
ncbi:hypothetical protein [Roseateles sp. P5_E8]